MNLSILTQTSLYENSRVVYNVNNKNQTSVKRSPKEFITFKNIN